MGYDVYLKQGVYSKWKLKDTICLIEKNACKKHGEKTSDYCDQCGKKTQKINNIWDYLPNLDDDDDISYRIKNDTIEILYAKELEEKVEHEFEDNTLYKMDFELIKEQENNFFTLNVILELQEHFTLIHKTQFFGKVESY